VQSRDPIQRFVDPRAADLAASIRQEVFERPGLLGTWSAAKWMTTKNAPDSQMRMVIWIGGGGTTMLRIALRLFGFTAALALATAAAQAPSVNEIFEKHQLLGTWSADCSKPLSRQNRSAVYRLIEGDRVQREVKSDPAAPGALAAADRAGELGPHEITISWVTERGRTNNTVRLEPNRFRLWHSADETGKQFVVEGREVDDNHDTLWIEKCGP
jgi:hypothetical protein